MKREAYVFLGGVLSIMLIAALGPKGGAQQNGGISYAKDVEPLLQKYCMPCHAEENANKSDLFLDSHDLLMKGGEHGKAVVPGHPEKSDLILKLSEAPPYGERMPLQSRRKLKVSPPKYMTEQEVQVLRQWISEGAKDN